jgi:Astacin (Peptidase family M12A)
VGRIGGSQSVTLGNGCFRIGTVMHELMHAVGFFHEQSRADRDKFIRIKINNVVPEARFNFNKHDLNSIQHLDAPYDTGIAHKTHF